MSYAYNIRNITVTFSKHNTRSSTSSSLIFWKFAMARFYFIKCPPHFYDSPEPPSLDLNNRTQYVSINLDFFSHSYKLPHCQKCGCQDVSRKFPLFWQSAFCRKKTRAGFLIFQSLISRTFIRVSRAFLNTMGTHFSFAFERKSTAADLHSSVRKEAVLSSSKLMVIYAHFLVLAVSLNLLLLRAYYLLYYYRYY